MLREGDRRTREVGRASFSCERESHKRDGTGKKLTRSMNNGRTSV